MIRIGICDDEKLFLDSLECMVMEVLKDQKKTLGMLEYLITGEDGDYSQV